MLKEACSSAAKDNLQDEEVEESFILAIFCFMIESVKSILSFFGCCELRAREIIKLREPAHA